MSDHFRMTVQNLVVELEGQDVPSQQTFNNMNRIGKLRLQLNQDVDRKRSMDIQAAKVLVIRSNLSSTTVQNQQEELLRPFGSNFY